MRHAPIKTRLSRSRVGGLSGILLKEICANEKGLATLCQALKFFGSDGRDRTYDQLINSQLLYR